MDEMTRTAGASSDGELLKRTRAGDHDAFGWPAPRPGVWAAAGLALVLWLGVYAAGRVASCSMWG